MPQMSKEQQIQHLYEWSNGLDTAGSLEAKYFEGWAQGLQKGQVNYFTDNG